MKNPKLCQRCGWKLEDADYRKRYCAACAKILYKACIDRRNAQYKSTNPKGVNAKRKKKVDLNNDPNYGNCIYL